MTAASAPEMDELRRKVEARLPGVRKILVEMRDSDDPDRIADGAFLLGMLDEMSDYVGLLREEREALRDELMPLVEEAWKLANDKRLASGEVFSAVGRVRLWLTGALA